jgi:uncharacterized protein
MTSLSFPDVNVWLALTLENHAGRVAALEWWDAAGGTIAFLRFTQVSFLRLLTTSSAMDGKPLTMAKAWSVYDRLFTDDRLALFPEPPGLEKAFRKLSSSGTPSPKVWADALLLASAQEHGGQFVTFDRALRSRNIARVLLSSGTTL